MPYALTRRTPYTLNVAMPRGRRWGVRGLGQCDDAAVASGDCDPSAPENDPTAVYGIVQGGSPNNVNETNLTGESVLPTGSIGSPCPQDPANVIVDAAGNCGPASTLLTNLSSASGAAALGLTAAQAAAITAALKVAQVAITGQPAIAPVAVSTTNPLASVSSTVWLVGGFGLLVMILLSKKR